MWETGLAEAASIARKPAVVAYVMHMVGHVSGDGLLLGPDPEPAAAAAAAAEGWASWAAHEPQEALATVSSFRERTSLYPYGSFTATVQLTDSVSLAFSYSRTGSPSSAKDVLIVWRDHDASPGGGVAVVLDPAPTEDTRVDVCLPGHLPSAVIRAVSNQLVIHPESEPNSSDQGATAGVMDISATVTPVSLETAKALAGYMAGGTPDDLGLLLAAVHGYFDAGSPPQELPHSTVGRLLANLEFRPFKILLVRFVLDRMDAADGPAVERDALIRRHAFALLDVLEVTHAAWQYAALKNLMYTVAVVLKPVDAETAAAEPTRAVLRLEELDVTTVTITTRLLFQHYALGVALLSRIRVESTMLSKVVEAPASDPLVRTLADSPLFAALYDAVYQPYLEDGTGKELDKLLRAFFADPAVADMMPDAHTPDAPRAEGLRPTELAYLARLVSEFDARNDAKRFKFFRKKSEALNKLLLLIPQVQMEAFVCELLGVAPPISGTHLSGLSDDALRKTAAVLDTYVELKRDAGVNVAADVILLRGMFLRITLPADVDPLATNIVELMRAIVNAVAHSQLRDELPSLQDWLSRIDGTLADPEFEWTPDALSHLCDELDKQFSFMVEACAPALSPQWSLIQDMEFDPGTTHSLLASGGFWRDMPGEAKYLEPLLENLLALRLLVSATVVELRRRLCQYLESFSHVRRLKQLTGFQIVTNTVAALGLASAAGADAFGDDTLAELMETMWRDKQVMRAQDKGSLGLAVDFAETSTNLTKLATRKGMLMRSIHALPTTPDPGAEPELTALRESWLRATHQALAIKETLELVRDHKSHWHTELSLSVPQLNARIADYYALLESLNRDVSPLNVRLSYLALGVFGQAVVASAAGSDELAAHSAELIERARGLATCPGLEAHMGFRVGDSGVYDWFNVSAFGVSKAATHATIALVHELKALASLWPATRLARGPSYSAFANNVRAFTFAFIMYSQWLGVGATLSLAQEARAMWLSGARAAALFDTSPAVYYDLCAAYFQASDVLRSLSWSWNSSMAFVRSTARDAAVARELRIVNADIRALQTQQAVRAEALGELKFFLSGTFSTESGSAAVSQFRSRVSDLMDYLRPVLVCAVPGLCAPYRRLLTTHSGRVVALSEQAALLWDSFALFDLRAEASADLFAARESVLSTLSQTVPLLKGLIAEDENDILQLRWYRYYLEELARVFGEERARLEPAVEDALNIYWERVSVADEVIREPHWPLVEAAVAAEPPTFPELAEWPSPAHLLAQSADTLDSMVRSMDAAEPDVVDPPALARTRTLLSLLNSADAYILNSGGLSVARQCSLLSSILSAVTSVVDALQVSRKAKRLYGKLFDPLVRMRFVVSSVYVLVLRDWGYASEPGLGVGRELCVRPVAPHTATEPISTVSGLRSAVLAPHELIRFDRSAAQIRAALLPLQYLYPGCLDGLVSPGSPVVSPATGAASVLGSTASSESGGAAGTSSSELVPPDALLIRQVYELVDNLRAPSLVVMAAADDEGSMLYGIDELYSAIARINELNQRLVSRASDPAADDYFHLLVVCLTNVRDNFEEYVRDLRWLIRLGVPKFPRYRASIKAPELGARLVRRSFALGLLPLGGRGSVRVEHGVHYKVAPGAPGVEVAAAQVWAGLSASLLGGAASPDGDEPGAAEFVGCWTGRASSGPWAPFDLMRISNGLEADAVLVTPLPHGVSLARLLEVDPHGLAALDLGSFTSCLVTSLVVSHGHAGPSNYVVGFGSGGVLYLTPSRVSEAFVDPVVVEEGRESGSSSSSADHGVVAAYDMILGLPHMGAVIPAEILERVARLPAELVIGQWLSHLRGSPVATVADTQAPMMERTVSVGFPQTDSGGLASTVGEAVLSTEMSSSGTAPLFSEQHLHALGLPLRMVPGEAQRVYARLVRIQRVIASAAEYGYALRGWDLFAGVHPDVAAAYEPHVTLDLGEASDYGGIDFVGEIVRVREAWERGLSVQSAVPPVTVNGVGMRRTGVYADDFILDRTQPLERAIEDLMWVVDCRSLSEPATREPAYWRWIRNSTFVRRLTVKGARTVATEAWLELANDRRFQELREIHLDETGGANCEAIVALATAGPWPRNVYLGVCGPLGPRVWAVLARRLPPGCFHLVLADGTWYTLSPDGSPWVGTEPDSETEAMVPLSELLRWPCMGELMDRLVRAGDTRGLAFLLDAVVGAAAHPAQVGEFIDSTGTLHVGVDLGHIGCVDLLLDHGADVDRVDSTRTQRTALHVACLAGSSRATVRKLLGRGADPRATDANGKTALHYAAEYAGAAAIDALLAADALVGVVHAADARVQDVLTLETAVPNRETLDPQFEYRVYVPRGVGVSTSTALVRQQAYLDTAEETDERTALHYACSFGRVESVRALLAAGADPNATNPDGWTALHWAARSGVSAVVEALVQAGAVRDSATVKGRVPLDEAIEFGHPRVVDILIADGSGVGVTELRQRVLSLNRVGLQLMAQGATCDAMVTLLEAHRVLRSDASAGDARLGHYLGVRARQAEEQTVMEIVGSETGVRGMMSGSGLRGRVKGAVARAGTDSVLYSAQVCQILGELVGSVVEGLALAGMAVPTCNVVVRGELARGEGVVGRGAVALGVIFDGSGSATSEQVGFGRALLQIVRVKLLGMGSGYLTCVERLVDGVGVVGTVRDMVDAGRRVVKGTGEDGMEPIVLMLGSKCVFVAAGPGDAGGSWPNLTRELDVGLVKWLGSAMSKWQLGLGRKVRQAVSQGVIGQALGSVTSTEADDLVSVWELPRRIVSGLAVQAGISGQASHWGAQIFELARRGVIAQATASGWTRYFERATRWRNRADGVEVDPWLGECVRGWLQVGYGTLSGSSISKVDAVSDGASMGCEPWRGIVMVPDSADFFSGRTESYLNAVKEMTTEPGTWAATGLGLCMAMQAFEAGEFTRARTRLRDVRSGLESARGSLWDAGARLLSAHTWAGVGSWTKAETDARAALYVAERHDGRVGATLAARACALLALLALVDPTAPEAAAHGHARMMLERMTEAEELASVAPEVARVFVALGSGCSSSASSSGSERGGGGGGSRSSGRGHGDDGDGVGFPPGHALEAGTRMPSSAARTPTPT